MRDASTPGGHFNYVLLRFAPGTAPKSEQKLRAFLAKQGCPDPSCLITATDSRPAEINGYRSARGLPLAIGVVLVLLLVATLTHVLVSTMRRRAADLAVLRAIGSSSRNLVATLRWQALVLTGSAILIGIPLGLIASRVAWRAFSSQLGIAPGTVTRSSSPRSPRSACSPSPGCWQPSPDCACRASRAGTVSAGSSPRESIAAGHYPPPSMTYSIAVELTTTHVGLAVASAVACAFSYGLSNVLQQREAEQIAQDQTLKLGLLKQLARRPRWLVGIGADVGGYVFEALALGLGTLVLVEPILATSLLCSLFLGGVINGRHISRSGWAAAVVLAAGVALFLYVVAPTQGVQVASNRAWLIAAPPIVGFVVVCIALGRITSGSARAAMLGLAAGTLFGVSGVLTKAFVHFLGDGIVSWVPHWEPYALAVSSITGLVLAQSAFQTGALAAAVSAEQVLQPLSGVALGVGLLDERLEISSSMSRLTLGAALAAMLWGVLALAREDNLPDVVPPSGLIPPSPRPAEG